MYEDGGFIKAPFVIEYLEAVKIKQRRFVRM